MPAEIIMARLRPRLGQPAVICYDTLLDVDGYQGSFSLYPRTSGTTALESPSKPSPSDNMASSPSPGSINAGTCREGSRIGRPPQWTVSRSRKLARLYLYTTLSIEKIIRVLEDDVFKPRKNSAQKTIHKMLDNDPRYLRPESRIEMNQRISNLTVSPTRRRKRKSATVQVLHKETAGATTEISSTSGSSRRTEDLLSFDFAVSPESLVSPVRFSFPFTSHGTDSSEAPGSSNRSSALILDLKRRVSDCSTQFAQQITTLIKDFSISGTTDDEASSGRRPSAALSECSGHEEHHGLETGLEVFEAFPEPGFALPGDFLTAHGRNCADFPGQQHGKGDCWCSIAAETSVDGISWLTPTGEVGARARQIMSHPSPANLSLRDVFGNTPLHVFAALEGCKEALFGMVLSADAFSLEAVNSAGQTFLHILNLDWFLDITSPSSALKQLLTSVTAASPNLVYKTDVYGRSFFHRAHSLVRDTSALVNLFSPFDPSYASRRDAFGFNPLVSIQTGTEGPYIPPRRGGSLSPQVQDLARHSSPSDEDSFLAYHARLVRVTQSSYNDPLIEDSEGRNGLHCLAEAIISQQTMDQHVQRSASLYSSSRPSLKRKLDSKDLSPPSPGVSNSPGSAGSSEGALVSRLRHLTGLLHSQVDVNHYDKAGYTPLMAFIRHIPDDQDDKSKTLLAILETLLRAGATLEARNRRGETALLVAARLGRKMALTTLLEHGASVYARDVDGKGVLEIVDEVCRSSKAKEDVSLYARMEACRVLLTGRRDWGVVLSPGVAREWRMRH
ncbi:hypothetical protein QBC38DRAFT_512695 [Podospora fimiseda]|uniref:Ankyrin repeat protein n=1 Tax=Podospora fimiseda TaxID=252190 RepID=A0AAN6YS25_9PEZI|nr:hypothetical protein QBC38DRAFT_512695 [Podospora fimiseda]